MNNKTFLKKIGLLDWLIILIFILMIIMFVTPKKVWKEEAKNRIERRNKMEAIVEAENFYYFGTYDVDFNGSYTFLNPLNESMNTSDEAVNIIESTILDVSDLG